MWKVRSSLAWRMARDFSKRSLQTLRSCASWKEGSPPLPSLPTKGQCTSPGAKNGPKWPNKRQANSLGSALQGVWLIQRGALTLGSLICFKSPLPTSPWRQKAPPEEAVMLV